MTESVPKSPQDGVELRRQTVALEAQRQQTGKSSGEAMTQQDERVELHRQVAALEAQCQQLARDLEQQALERQRINAELEKFAFAASHDLQEPLRKIQAFGNLLTKARDGLSEEGRDYVGRMQEGARRMQVMIEGLLEYSRVTTRAQSFEPVDLTRVARAVALALKARIERTGGRLEMGELPTVEADPAQMKQLLWHLIHNGFKFRRPEESPVVRVRGEVLQDGTEGSLPGYGRCHILVEDNGIGFEEMFVDRLFGVFQRLNGRSEYEGTGVGLAVCRKVAERHGGSIAVRSAPGRGATFIVTLPLRQNEAGGTP